MLSSTNATPLRPWGATSYSLLNGFVTPFRPPTQPVGGRQNMSLEEFKKLSLAGLYMRAAVTPGRHIQHLTTLESIQACRAYYSVTSQLLIWLALLGIIFVTFFEDGPSVLPAVSTLLVEAICFVILIAKLLEKRGFMGADAFSKDASSIIHLCLLLVLLLDFVVGVLHPLTESPPAADTSSSSTRETFYRYGRAIRPFLVMDHAPAIRHRLSDLAVAAWRSRTTLLLVAFNVTFFAVVATILFHNRGADDREGFDSFNDLGTSLVTLIILQTTSNSPDVFVPFYYESRWSALFFIIFLIMSHFLLLNLVLGVTYHEHTKRLRMAASSELLDSYVAARASMAVLADDIGTNRGEDEAEFAITCKMLSMEFGMTEQATKKLLYRCGATVDGVTRESFSKIPKAVMLRMTAFDEFIAEDSEDEDGEDRLKRRIRHVLSKKMTTKLTYVDGFVVISLLVMLLSLMAEINYDFDVFLESESEGFTVDLRSRAFWSGILTVVFGIELCLKLFAYGFFLFTDDLWNVFDSTCVIISLLGVLGLFPPKTSVLLTEARIMRLLRVVPGFRNVVGIAAAFAPAVGPSISAILCVFFTNAVIVVGIFGNVRLAPEDYKGNDFRDFAAALVTLFQLSIVNDWNATMAAFVNATGNKAVRGFFIFWWAVSQLLLYNTVTSLVLDGFEVSMKEQNAWRNPELSKPPTNNDSALGDRRVPFQPPPNSPTVNELRQLNLIRTLSSGERVLRVSSLRERPNEHVSKQTDDSDDDNSPMAPLMRGASFTVGRMFLELFRDISEPTDREVDIACWERGIRVGKSPWSVNGGASADGVTFSNQEQVFFS